MATPAQIEEQVQFERDAIRCGVEKLRKTTQSLEDKDYASATAYGSASMDVLLPRVVEQIENTKNRIHEGKTGAQFKVIHQYLSDLQPLGAAAIAVKLIFDKVFHQGRIQLSCQCHRLNRQSCRTRVSDAVL